MLIEESKSTLVGTIELALQMDGVEAILAGLEQIKVAAQEAAAAVASIGCAQATPVSAHAIIADMAVAASFADQWVREVRRGQDACGMPPRTAAEFILALTRLEAE